MPDFDTHSTPYTGFPPTSPFWWITSRELSIPMAVLQSMLYVLFLFLTALPVAWALKFDLTAHMGHEHKYERCIRNFVGKDTLVLVTAIVDGSKGDGQVVNMHVRPSKLGSSVTRGARTNHSPSAD